LRAQFRRAVASVGAAEARVSSLTEPDSQGELLGEIEALIARRGRMRFPAWLARRFEADTGARYAEVLREDMKRTALFYNIMFSGDLLLARDAVRWSAGLHVLVTAALLGFAFALRRWRIGPLARDLCAAAAPALITLQVLAVFAFSASPVATHYLFFVPLNTATVNSAMRIRHRAAAWATYAAFLALSATLVLSAKAPLPVAVMAAITMYVCGVITLRGMADREREFRRAYLHGLRDRLRIAASDAEASRDALTGAANRRGLDAAARAAFEGEPRAVAVILFDIDKFKAFNDLYGHLAGDGCLQRVGACALAVLAARAGDAATLARYGGEEFLALLTGEPAAQAAEIAESLRLAILALEIAHHSAAERVVSASFGVARGSSERDGFEALVAAADAALYRSKSAGRNKVSLARAA
jgi:diguanylate cyclase (GGDEF)-like protein